MLIIKLLLGLAALLLYGLAGKTILKLLKMPTTLQALGIYVVSGPIAGILAVIIQATVLAEEQGHIGHEPQILSLFTIALLIAIAVSVLAVKLFVRPPKI